MKRTICVLKAVFMCLLSAILLVSVLTPAKAEYEINTAITSDETDIFLKPGGYSKKLTYTLNPSNSTDPVTFSLTYAENNCISLNKATGTVTTNDTTGEAVVTAQVSDNYLQYRIYVAEDPSNIVVDRQTFKIQPNKSMYLVIGVVPETAKSCRLKVTCNDSSLKFDPVVSAAHLLYITSGSKLGTFTVTLTADNGISRSFNIQVTNEPLATRITSEYSQMSLEPYESKKLPYTLYPSDSVDTLLWKISSDNYNCISVDQNGVVTATGNTGQAVVYAAGYQTGLHYYITVCEDAQWIQSTKLVHKVQKGTWKRVQFMTVPSASAFIRKRVVSHNESIAYPQTLYTTDNSIAIYGNELGTTQIRVSADNNDVVSPFGDFTIEVVDEPVEDTDLVVMGHSLSLDGKIGVNFYIDVPYLAVDTSNVRIRSNEQNILTKASAAPTRNVQQRELRVFTCAQAAKEMRDTILVTAEDNNGNKRGLWRINDYTDTGYPYTVADYLAEAQVNGSAKLKPLAEAMDTYGKYTQIYFDHNVTDEVRNVKDISYVTANTVLPYKYTTSGSVTGLSYAGGSTVLEADTSYRVYFKPETGHSISEYTATIDGTPVSFKAAPNSSGLHYIEKSNIAAQNIDQMNTIKITRGNETLTMKYGALSYVYNALSSEAAEKTKNMCRALYLYNQASKAYFGN